jgi:hypothetical protein
MLGMALRPSPELTMIAGGTITRGDTIGIEGRRKGPMVGSLKTLITRF